MNGFDNEHVEIAQLYGSIADDLFGAFAEFEAVASGTRAQNYLYSLSINPPEPLSREQYDEAIAQIEDGLGLKGQPRAVVFHIKHGREHCHVVWSRIDIDKMKAIHMAYDHEKLMDISISLAANMAFRSRQASRPGPKNAPLKRKSWSPHLPKKHSKKNRV